jgi:hypothetical protein
MDRAEFLAHIYALCREHGGSVTSWVRSEKRNATVGGNPNSRHLEGLAVDVVLDDRFSRDQFIRACNARHIGTLDEGDHIHCQTRRPKESV